jgi:phosphoribosyl 1,2-cyclic phosphodiesterase
MSLRVCVLASGSSGNCTYIGSDNTAILIDAGLSGKETERRLGDIGVSPESIRGICLSHEHNDHTSGLRVLHRRYEIPLFANAGTVEAVSRDPKLSELPWQVFTTGSSFTLGDLSVEPFSVAHDAYEPVGFVVRCGAARAGVVTDMGVVTTLVRERLKECQVVIVEANHDEDMLQSAERPWSLKQRIAGRQGHLSNRHAAEMLAAIAGPKLSHVFLAHLSADCNREDLAVQTTRETLGRTGNEHVKVSCAYPDRVSEIWFFGGA